MDAIGAHTDRQITNSRAQELLAMERQCMPGEEHSCVSGTVLFPSHTLSRALFCLSVHPTKGWVPSASPSKRMEPKHLCCQLSYILPFSCVRSVTQQMSSTAQGQRWPFQQPLCPLGWQQWTPCPLLKAWPGLGAGKSLHTKPPPPQNSAWICAQRWISYPASACRTPLLPNFCKS